MSESSVLVRLDFSRCWSSLRRRLAAPRLLRIILLVRMGREVAASMIGCDRREVTRNDRWTDVVLKLSLLGCQTSWRDS